MRRAVRLLAIAAVACPLLWGVPAGAQFVTAARADATLAQQAEAYQYLTGYQDADAIVALMPPGVLAVMTDQAGGDEAGLRAALASGIETQWRAYEVVGLEMDTDGARRGTLEGGEPYAIVPTTTTVRAPDGRLGVVESETFALKSEATGWHLLRVDMPATADLIRAAYPSLSGVAFAPVEAGFVTGEGGE